MPARKLARNTVFKKLVHQQNQNYREPLTCTVVRIKDRGKSIFSVGLFEIEMNIVVTRMPRPKMG